MAEQDSTCASTEKPTVEYRDIEGFPGYRIGSDGTVWSCWKRVYSKKIRRPVAIELAANARLIAAAPTMYDFINSKALEG